MDSLTVTADSPAADSDRRRSDSLYIIADRSRMMGSENAKVWLIMMSDFQCPYCRRFHDETYPAIRERYVDSGLIRIAFVNFPGAARRHARLAAEYAMCAGLQQNFWEYHDALFESFDRWSGGGTPVARFDSLAGALSLDVSALQLCLSSGSMRRLVDDDLFRSTGTGADGTPAFLIDGKLLVGAHPFSAFAGAIDSALARAGQGNRE